jgi:putative hydrolase of the HAD superfamily
MDQYPWRSRQPEGNYRVTRAPTALLLDFGGVLTNDFWEVLRSYARRDGLHENALVDLVTKDAEGIELLHSLECGAIGQSDFEREVATRLGVAREGLLRRMAADLRPDEQMLDVVAELRHHGVKIAILSNSWGSDSFDPYAPWRLEDRADVVIISDRVRLRKPDPGIFELAIDKLAVPPSACVFIDDIAAYLEPARTLGMNVLHHASSANTIEELHRLFACYL